MKLNIWHHNGQWAEFLGTVGPNEPDNPLVKNLPPVSSRAGIRLVPADGDAYLRAVHTEMQMASPWWSELIA